MTRFVDVDLETGAVHIPAQTRLAPKSLSAVFSQLLVLTCAFIFQRSASQGQTMAGCDAIRGYGEQRSLGLRQVSIRFAVHICQFRPSLCPRLASTPSCIVYHVALSTIFVTWSSACSPCHSFCLGWAPIVGALGAFRSSFCYAFSPCCELGTEDLSIPSHQR